MKEISVVLNVILWALVWIYIIKSMWVGVEFDLILWFRFRKSYTKKYNEWISKRPTKKDFKITESEANNA